MKTSDTLNVKTVATLAVAGSVCMGFAFGSQAFFTAAGICCFVGAWLVFLCCVI